MSAEPPNSSPTSSGPPPSTSRGGLIAWFVDNPVAANLLMLTMLLGGAVGLSRVALEVYPDFSPGIVTVQVAYRGASPEDVAESICEPLEGAVQGVVGVKQVRCTALEGLAIVSLRLLSGVDAQQVVDRVETRVGALDTLPEGAEAPRVEELVARSHVMTVVVAADPDRVDLRSLAQEVRRDLIALPEVSVVELAPEVDQEIRVELDPTRLQAHGLSVPTVAAAIHDAVAGTPAGVLHGAERETQLRARDRARTERDYASIPLLARGDGRSLTVEGLGTVSTGPADDAVDVQLEDQAAVVLNLFRIGDQDATDIAAAVHAYVEARNARLPASGRVIVWMDDSELLRGRMRTLVENGVAGFALVVALLALFQGVRLAFWVAVGIPTAFAGVLWLMPSLDVTLNLVSGFGFVLVLGILVDDAIVTGESIFEARRSGLSEREAAIRGTRRVVLPVSLGVLTTALAFLPLLFMSGGMGKMARILPAVVVPALLFSLIESKFILPAHLAAVSTQIRGQIRGRARPRIWASMQAAARSFLDRHIAARYRTVLTRGLRRRWTVLAIAGVGLGSTLVVTAIWGPPFAFFPPVEANYVTARVTLSDAASPAKTRAVLERLRRAARTVAADVEAESGQRVVVHDLSYVGLQPLTPSESFGQAPDPSRRGAHLGQLAVALVDADHRSISASEFERRWRDAVGTLDEVRELTFSSALVSMGSPLDIQIAADDAAALQDPARAVHAALDDFAGTTNVSSSIGDGKPRLEFELTPLGESLGLSHAQLAEQVRAAYHGARVDRVRVDGREVDVIVRARDRATAAELNALPIQLPSSPSNSEGVGGTVPFGMVATTRTGVGPLVVRRVEQRPVANITADVDLSAQSPLELLRRLRDDVVPELEAAGQGVKISFEGQLRDQEDTAIELAGGYVVVLVAMYGLLAIPLRSYVLPLIILSAVPFGAMGAMLGHLVLGEGMTMLSVMGVVACSGVVVNDTLVLLVRIRERVQLDSDLSVAIRTAAQERLRPIVMTSATTVVGLLPLLFETSTQARFLVPMAISLAFGVALCTVVTLIVVPAGCLLVGRWSPGVFRAPRS